MSDAWGDWKYEQETYRNVDWDFANERAREKYAFDHVQESDILDAVWVALNGHGRTREENRTQAKIAYDEAVIRGEAVVRADKYGKKRVPAAVEQKFAHLRCVFREHEANAKFTRTGDNTGTVTVGPLTFTIEVTHALGARDPHIWAKWIDK